MNKLILILLSLGLFFSCKYDSQIKPESTISNNSDSLYIKRYTNGMVKEICQVINGKLDGKFFSFFEDGSKMKEYNFEKGIQSGLQYAFFRGCKISEIYFENGKENGWARFFHPGCDHVRDEGAYLYGKREGLWYDYRNKRLTSISIYKLDSIVKVQFQGDTNDESISEQPELEEDCGSCN